MSDALKHIIHSIRFEIITDDRGAALQMQDMVSELMQVDLVNAIEKELSKHSISGHHLQFEKITLDLKQINHSQFKYEVLHFVPRELSRQLDTLITQFNYAQLAPIEVSKTDESSYRINNLALYLETGIWSLSNQERQTSPKDLLYEMMQRSPEELKALIRQIQRSKPASIPRLAALLTTESLKTFVVSASGTGQRSVFQSIYENMFSAISAVDKRTKISRTNWELLAKKILVREIIEMGAKTPDPAKFAKEVTAQLSKALKQPSYIFHVEKSGKIQLSPVIVKATEKKKKKETIEQIVKELSSLVTEQDAKLADIPWPPEGFEPLSPKESPRDKVFSERIKSEKEALAEFQRRLEHRKAIEEKLKLVAEKAEAEEAKASETDAITSRPALKEEPSSEDDTKQAKIDGPKPPDISAALYRYLTGEFAWWDTKTKKQDAATTAFIDSELSGLVPAQIVGLFQWLRKSNQLSSRSVGEDEVLKTIKAIRSEVLVARLVSTMPPQIIGILIAEFYPGQQRLIHFLELSLQYLTAPLKNMITTESGAQPLKQILLQRYIEGKKSITGLKDARSEIYAVVKSILPERLLIPLLQSLSKFGPGRDMESIGGVPSRPDIKLVELPFLRRFAEEWPISSEQPKDITDKTSALESISNLSMKTQDPAVETEKPDSRPAVEKSQEDAVKKEQFMASMLAQLTQFAKQVSPKIGSAKEGKEFFQLLIDKIGDTKKDGLSSLQKEDIKTLFYIYALLTPESLYKTGLEVLYSEPVPLDVDHLTISLNKVFALDPLTVIPTAKPTRVQRKDAQIDKPGAIDEKAVESSLKKEVSESKVDLPIQDSSEDIGTVEKTKDSEKTSAKEEAEEPTKPKETSDAGEAPDTAAPLTEPEKPKVPETEKHAIKEKETDIDHSKKEPIPETEESPAEALEKVPQDEIVPPLRPVVSEQDDAWQEMISRMKSGVWAIKLLQQSLEMPMKTLDDLTEDIEKALFIVYVEEGRIPPELILEGLPVEKEQIVRWLNKVLEKRPAWLQKSLVRIIASPASIERLLEALDTKGILLILQILGSKNKALLPWLEEMFLQSKKFETGEKDRTLMLKVLMTMALKPNLDADNVFLYFLKLHLKFAEKEFGLSAKDWLYMWDEATPHIQLQPEQFDTAKKLVKQQIEDRKSRPDFNKYFVMDNEWPQRSFLTEKVMVNNAGAVLLNPFLLHLFKVTELLDDQKQFKSPGHVWQAIQMLHYAVTKQKNTMEFEILLYKLLCGMEPDWLPPEEGSTLNEKHIPLIDSMLQAVIGQWSALGKSSIDNLRESFLIRNGLIEDQGSRWEITVEQKPWDILVEKIPWTIGFIKLPWMKKRIQVIWR